MRQAGSVAITSYMLHVTLEIKNQLFFLVVSRANIMLSLGKQLKKLLQFDLKKYIHITFAGKVCNIPIKNLGCCPLHWHAALERQMTAMNFSKRKLSLEVQPNDTHLFGISMSIFKIMVI